MRIAKSIGALMGAMLMGSVLQAADRLTLYCSPQIEWCELMVNTFEKQTGIRVSMTRKSSGETLAQIKAEKSNPKGDVWWGGTGDPHLQAAEEGLTEAYNSPMLSQLQDWALSPHKSHWGRTVGIYMGGLGYGYNKELLASKGLPAPKMLERFIESSFQDKCRLLIQTPQGPLYHPRNDGTVVWRGRWL